MCTVLLPPGGYPTAVNKNYINLHVPHGHWLFLVRFLLTPTCTFFFCVKGNLLWPWVPPSLPNVGTGFSFPEVKRGFHHPSPYKRRGRVWLQLYLYLPWALYCVFRVNLKKKILIYACFWYAPTFFRNTTRCVKRGLPILRFTQRDICKTELKMVSCMRFGNLFVARLQSSGKGSLSRLQICDRFMKLP